MRSIKIEPVINGFTVSCDYNNSTGEYKEPETAVFQEASDVISFITKKLNAKPKLNEKSSKHVNSIKHKYSMAIPK